MATYQGKKVQSRPAKASDEGYDEKEEQVVVTLPDGSKKTVPAAEVTEE